MVLLRLRITIVGKVKRWHIPWVKKLIAVSLCLVQIFFFSPPARGAYDGCPDSWPIPRNLMAATADQLKTFWTPDFNTVVRPSDNSQYSFDGTRWTTVKGIWVNIPKPEQVLQRNHEVNTLMSFFWSRWEDITLIRLGDFSWIKEKQIFLKTFVNVSKQGCGSPTTFFYEKNYFPPGEQVRSFSTEIEKLKNNFRNFEFFEAALSKYSACISAWQGYNRSRELRKPLDTCYIGSIRGASSGVEASVEIRLIPNEQGCLEFLNGNANTASTVGVRAGSSCSYSIIGFKGDNYANWISRPDNSNLPFFYDALEDKIITFGTLQISAKPIQKTITCAKGKILKKVSAINPSCPKGFTRR